MLIHEHDPEYSNDEAFLCFYQAYFKNTKKQCPEEGEQWHTI